MSIAGSVSHWLARLKAGDPAAQPLWEKSLQQKDPELRTVALWKMEGYTTEEIAHQLGCLPRSVKRRLRLIRTARRKEIVHE